MINYMQKHTIIALKMQGHSNRKIQRDLGINRKTIAKYWSEYQKQIDTLHNSKNIKLLQENITSPPKYDSSNRRPRKYTPEINMFVDKILQSEEDKCKLLGLHKQRLSSSQIHEMVVDKGFDIGLTTLSEQIRIKRNKVHECFIRQDYQYGDRLEYDFGEVRLIIGNTVCNCYLAVFSSPASNYRWAYLYKSQSKDVFMDSHIRFFEMIGGVYKELVYDNMRNVVSKFIGRNEKILNEDLIKLSLYYGFRINVTNCFSGNEKGHVEGSVKIIRNRVFAKAYQFATFDEAEEYLHQQLLVLNEKSSFTQEKEYLSSAKPPLELAKISAQKVDKYSFVRVENNFYSVPEYLVGREVIVKNYLKEILIYSENTFTCRHKKVDGFNEMVVDIHHYLDTFQRKPQALKNSLALKSIAELKTIYDEHFTTRTREFIEILKNNQDKDVNELLEIYTKAAKYHIISFNVMEDNVSKRSKEQIIEMSKIFNLGGKSIVH